MKIFGENTLHAKGQERSVNVGDVVIHAKFVENRGIEIEFSLKNSSNISKFVENLKIGELVPTQRVFVNNFQSWGPCTFIKVDEVLNDVKKVNFNAMMSIVPWEFKDGVVSDYFIATHEEFAGFLSSKIAHPYFVLKDGIIEAKFHIAKTLKPNEEMELGTLWIKKNYKSLEDTLDEYAKKVAKINKPRIGKPLFGWSSWYHYYLDISQDAFVEEVKRSKALKMNYELFQLDDGYESDIGDWLQTNEKFPSGLEFIAKTVKENAMIAGIWTAPFSVSESSKLFTEHRNWLAKDEKGDPIVAYENWNKKIYALDTTHPQALKWLKELFSTLKKIGFDFFKIDFLFAGMIPAKRHLNATPVEAYRMGMEAIREAVGDSHVLGCGAPLLESIGYVDSMRIGADTALYWKSEMDLGQPSAKFSIRNALTRHFMNAWWTNDPDCVMVRSNETELSHPSLFDSNLEGLSNERMINVYVPALLNDHVLQSDKLSVLTKEDIFFLKNALNFRNGSARVKFVDSEKYVIRSEKTINGDVISFVNLSDSVWNVKIKDFSDLNEKPESFFISYPHMKELKASDSLKIKPHSISIVLHRSKRKLSREDEKKEDGRDFHYYRDDDV